MIDTEEKLKNFLPKLQAAEWVAIDTEADSLHAYPEKLCLIQISLSGSDELIDPLAELDLAHLLKELQRRALILHGADYDLRLLKRGLQFVPGAIFDTMWAARLLGYTEFGLVHLVQKNLGVTLEKGPQKMNWAQRPLSERMERYARNDTRYLQPVAKILKQQLQEKGRLDWHREVCVRLIEEAIQERVQDPDLVWRIKRSDRLNRQGLAVLRELWKWREEEALEKNKPPYFIVSHEALAGLAAAASMEKPIEELLPAHMSLTRQERLMAALERGLKQPTAAQPHIRRPTGYRLDRAEQSRFDKFKLLRDRRAAELEIDPTLIASRSLLVALARDWEKSQRELMSWQRTLLT